jgi:hypothetical protein
MYRAEQQFIAFRVAHIKVRRIYRAMDNVDQPKGRDLRGRSA